MVLAFEYPDVVLTKRTCVFRDIVLASLQRSQPQGPKCHLGTPVGTECRAEENPPFLTHGDSSSFDYSLAEKRYINLETIFSFMVKIDEVSIRWISSGHPLCIQWASIGHPLGIHWESSGIKSEYSRHSVGMIT